MKEKIEQRLAGHKEEKEAWIIKQKQYRWTDKEKEEGSTTYGYYQEQEVYYNNKITELEWVLSLFLAENNYVHGLNTVDIEATRRTFDI